MSLRNSILLLVWLLLAPCNIEIAFSQTKEIDSLKLALSNEIEDTNKVNTLYKIGEQFWNRYDYENTIKYTDSSLRLAKKIKFTSKEFNALMCLGNVNAFKSKISEAHKYFSAAIELSKQTGNKKKVAETYIEIASCYKFALNYPEAFKNAFIALKLFEEIGNKYNIAQTWLMIGRIYSYQENFTEVENCCKKALILFYECPERKKDDIATCYHYIGRANLFKGNYTNAIEMLSAALKIWQETGNIYFMNGTNYHIGLVYKRLGERASANGDEITAKKMYTECRKKFSSYLPLPEDDNNFLYIAENNQELGDINILLKNFPKARQHLKKALEFTEATKLLDTYRDIYGSLSRLDSAEGNYKQALEHYKIFILYRDSIINQERSKKTEEYKMQYEFDKKEDSLKQKQFITEAKLGEQKKQRYFYWVGLALLALLSFFIFLNFRNQKKINRLAIEAHANEKTELELQSLRAQLNPHFIFNCINSIDAFIHSHDKYNATLYLNKFAKLLRNILDSSKQNTVAFTKDIETLKLYIELEELRNDNKFKTIINIDRELLDSDYKVPPLIIQPFVENAILHGLKNKDGDNGLLEIEIKKIQDKIEYCIKDNGIGRQAAAQIVKNKESSYGIQLSFDRIRLFNKEQEASVNVTDLYEGKNATGTLIKVQLQII